MSGFINGGNMMETVLDFKCLEWIFGSSLLNGNSETNKAIQDLASVVKSSAETVNNLAAQVKDVKTSVEDIESRLEKLERNNSNNHDRIKKLEAAKG